MARLIDKLYASYFDLTALKSLVPDQHPALRHIMPSSDFFRGCQAALAVKPYYRATQEVAIYLSCMFEVAYPEYHAKYTAAFKAGVWETADPGPWIGRAIVYKLQVSEHVDGLDDGPTASFCVTSTGELCTWQTLDSYHCVGKWSPAVGISPEGITPGRISHVFFSPQNSIAQLDGKPEGWMMRTMGGSSVDSDEGGCDVRVTLNADTLFEFSIGAAAKRSEKPGSVVGTNSNSVNLS
ncbi:hypothetical protein B0H14DRAFT_2576314 [Mycena olivaceomarginata]|nr:hypothetical protein B0H14DRAFT_2576314 [Mycena olivaceomarginata]